MSRIILGMAITNYLLVAITAYLGLMSDPGADPNQLGEDLFRYHFLMGLMTALFTMLVHCLVFTYFLGTNRWVKETAAAYSLNASFVTTSRKYRMRAFRVAILSMLLVVATIATGAGAHTKTWPTGYTKPFLAITYVLMLFAYRIEISAIEDHTELTDKVMDEVYRIRGERKPVAV